MAVAPLAEDPRDLVFERLYTSYVRDVYRYVLAVLRNPSEAEDVTQTTFLNAYRALRAGERPLKPQNWLLTIAHNACRSRIRSAMRRPREVPLDVAVVEVAVPEPDRPNVRELVRALGRLPLNQRSAIALRELEGRSYPEIADALGVTVPAVEALLARARKALREKEALLRGIALLPLRFFFGAGSAAVKAAALLATAGAVAGGVVYAEQSAPPRHQHTLPAVLVETPVPAAAATAGHARRAAATPRRHAHVAPAAAPTGGAHPDTADGAPSTSAPPATPPAAQPTAAPAAQPAATTATTAAAVPPLPATVPSVPVQTPTVSVPTLPDPPQLPSIP
jgi:RNA polymerase sigma factor (sigma-70 family)